MGFPQFSTLWRKCGYALGVYIRTKGGKRQIVHFRKGFRAAKGEAWFLWKIPLDSPSRPAGGKTGGAGTRWEKAPGAPDFSEIFSKKGLIL